MTDKKNAKTKAPSFQFYPGDWLNDSALRMCSPETRGIWIDLLCHMHQSCKYGYLIINDVILNKKEIQKLIQISPKKFQKVFNELTTLGILKRQNDGAYYSKRMVADEEFRNKRKAWGELGKKHGVKGKDYGKLGGRPKTSKGGFKGDIVGDKKTPLKPPPSSSSSDEDTPIRVSSSSDAENKKQKITIQEFTESVQGLSDDAKYERFQEWKKHNA